MISVPHVAFVIDLCSQLLIISEFCIASHWTSASPKRLTDKIHSNLGCLDVGVMKRPNIPHSSAFCLHTIIRTEAFRHCYSPFQWSWRVARGRCLSIANVLQMFKQVWFNSRWGFLVYFTCSTIVLRNWFVWRHSCTYQRIQNPTACLIVFRSGIRLWNYLCSTIA